MKLTNEEISLAIEALLFSASADMCAEWKPEHSVSMIEVAKKLNYMAKNDIEMKNIYLFGKQSLFEDKDTAKNIRKNFKIKVRR